jgi:hypothetical protein
MEMRKNLREKFKILLKKPKILPKNLRQIQKIEKLLIIL